MSCGRTLFACTALSLLVSSAARAQDERYAELATGNWGGTRDRWIERGVEPFFNYTLDALQVFKGGYERGTSVQGLVDFGVEADLHKLLHGVGSLRLHGLYFHGDDPTAELVGDFAYLDNIVAAGGVRLYQITYSTDLDGWNMKFGLTAVDEDFGNAETAVLFVNSAFGPVSTLSWNSGLAIWPTNVLGVRVERAVNGNGFFRLGVYDGGAEPDGNSRRGTRVRLKGADGAIAVVETGFSWGTEEASGLLQVGGWWHSGEFQDHGTAAALEHNHGFHVSLEQPLNDAGTWRGFARFGHAPREDRSIVQSHFDAGLTGAGLIPGRPADALGLAYFRTSFSDDYLAARWEGGDAVTRNEAGLELTYSIALAPGIWLQPDLQYLFSVHEAGDDVIAGIVRLYIDF